jgi:hypothetical protein
MVIPRAFTRRLNEAWSAFIQTDSCSSSGVRLSLCVTRPPRPSDLSHQIQLFRSYRAPMESRKPETNEEEQAFLSRPSEDGAVNSSSSLSESRTSNCSGGRKRKAKECLRLVLEIAMAATIVYLLVFKPFVVARETIRRTPVPRCTSSDRYQGPKDSLLTLLLSSTPEDIHFS